MKAPCSRVSDANGRTQLYAGPAVAGNHVEPKAVGRAGLEPAKPQGHRRGRAALPFVGERPQGDFWQAASDGVAEAVCTVKCHGSLGITAATPSRPARVQRARVVFIARRIGDRTAPPSVVERNEPAEAHQCRAPLVADLLAVLVRVDERGFCRKRK